MLDLSDAKQPLDLKNGVVFAPRCFQPATIGGLGGRLYASSGLSAGGGIWSRNAGITHHIRAKSPSAPVQAAVEIGVR